MPSDRRATSSCPASRSCPEATRRARSRACWRPRRTQADWDAPLGWARGASRAQCAPDPVAWEGLRQRPRGRFREPTPDLRGRTGPLRLGTGSPQCPSRGRLASMAPRALDRARQPQPRSSQRSPPSAALLWTSESQRLPVLDAPVWTSGGRPTRQSAPGSCRATRSGRWRPPHRLLRPADRAAGWRVACETVAPAQQRNAPPGRGAPREDQANPDLPLRSLKGGSGPRTWPPRALQSRHAAPPLSARWAESSCEQ
jgi:hypothetical protein